MRPGPAPGRRRPGSPDLDHCAICLGLLASANFVAAAPTPLPVPAGADLVYLEAAFHGTGARGPATFPPATTRTSPL